MGDVDYGAYFVGADEVVFVPLSECRAEDDGTYTYHHGTKDGATVSEDVDTATNADPSMGTNFYVNIKNGLDPDGSTSEEVVPGKTDDGRVEYEVTIATKATYQLKATVPSHQGNLSAESNCPHVCLHVRLPWHRQHHCPRL